MSRIALSVLLLSIALAAAAETVETRHVARTLETLRLAVNSHDYRSLEPELAETFTYQGRDARFSRMIMQQVVEGYPHEIAEIVILGIASAGDAWEVAVRLVGPAGTEQRSVRLSRDYRLLQADIANIALAGHGGSPDAPAASPPGLPESMTVPFTLAENLIFVDAEINGVAGNYLVDTGAQAIVLNATRFGPDNLTTVPLNHAPPSGVGGVMQDVRGASGIELEWGAVRIDALRALVTDLTHLESSIGIPVAGIIGFTVLERFELDFDYAASQLTLFRLDENGHPLVASGRGEPLQVTAFDMASHLPVLPIRIAGLDLRLGLDSGAGGAMLNEQWQEPLSNNYEFIERSELRGGDRNVQMGDVVRIDRMQLEAIDYTDIRFRFNDMAAHDGKAMRVDGLLGYEFLSRRPTAINFRRQELKVWEAAGD